MGNSRQARRSDVPQRSGQSLYKQAVPAVIVEIPEQAEYESVWTLLGYSPMERFFRSLKRMGAGDGLRKLQRCSPRNNGLYRWVLQHTEAARI